MSKTIKTQSGESITVDDDVHAILKSKKLYLQRDKNIVFLCESSKRLGERINIVTWLVKLHTGKMPKNTRHWYTMKNGDYLDCRYENISTERPSDNLYIKMPANDKVRWKKLSRKVNKSMACIIREKMNDECDKKGV